MISRLTIVLAAFLTLGSVDAWAQTEAEQPWDYLYSVRTPRLYELGAVLKIFPEQSGLAQRFSNSLSSQKRPVALRDAAKVLSYRHGLELPDWKLLILATRSPGLWVEGEVLAKRNRLSPIERTRLLQSLADAAVWLADARELGAGDTEAEEAAEILTRAYARLEAL